MGAQGWFEQEIERGRAIVKNWTPERRAEMERFIGEHPDAMSPELAAMLGLTPPPSVATTPGGMTPAELRALADQIESKECTGITATWCPVHGDCTCERDEFGVPVDGAWQYGRCPLHGEQSSHAAPEPDHEVAPDPWAPEGGYPAVDLF